MSTDSLVLARPDVVAATPLVDQLHGWVITVDHKRLGMLYIGCALVFMSLGGIEAAAMAR